MFVKKCILPSVTLLLSYSSHLTAQEETAAHPFTEASIEGHGKFQGLINNQSNSHLS